MYRKHNSRRGISAIVSGIIILAIFFATVIPLVVLMQNSYTIFLQESNSRRIFDTDRASESLIVEVSQNNITKELLLVLLNSGPVYIKPVRVWAIDVTRQKSITGSTPCLEEGLEGLTPGRNATLSVQQCVNGFTGIVEFLVVSEKGRLFASSRVNLTGGRLVDIIFPYTLSVSILNMKRGSTYTVRVDVIGNEGNISPSTFTHKATASNENVTVAFGATAGKYRISLYENNILAKVKENPITITIPDTTTIIFDLERVAYQPIPLDIIFDAPRKVFAVQAEEESFTASIWVQLPKNALEPVDINEVDTSKIGVIGDTRIVQELICMHYTGFTLRPGERAMVATCTVVIKHAVTGKYSLNIVAYEGTTIGEGFYSSLTYINSETISSAIDVFIRKK